MREREIKELLWGRFLKWMRGQTCSTYPNGETDYYAHDVGAYLDKLDTGYDRQKSVNWD